MFIKTYFKEAGRDILIVKYVLTITETFFQIIILILILLAQLKYGHNNNDCEIYSQRCN